MIETTSTLTPYEVDDLDATTLLECAVEAETQERVAQRRKLRLAAQWCVLHPATPDTGSAAWGDHGLPGLTGCDAPLGGEGTPDVAAFTPEPLAAALGISPSAATALMADALDLSHRLPRVWRAVEQLRVPAWKARRVAERTRSLSAQAAGWVDRELEAVIETCGWSRIDQLIALAVARFHPDRLEAHEKRGRHGWDVQLHHQPDVASGLGGISHLSATGDLLDLSRFYDVVCDTAHQLEILGDSDPLGARKAKALGLIADAYSDPDLLTGTGPVLLAAPGSPAAAATGALAARADRESRRRLARTSLYLHLSLAGLVAGHQAGESQRGEHALGTVEGLSPVTADQIRAWVGHSQVTVTPVLDLAADPAMDAHHPPAWMRELVIVRDRHCVFPGCSRDARRCDLDHIVAYDDTGPPGQTRPSNLAPLCRRHHRAKTLRLWRYQRQPDGSYLWDSPLQRRYLVTSDGTFPLD